MFVKFGQPYLNFGSYVGILRNMLAEILDYQRVAYSDMQPCVSTFRLWPYVSQHASSDMTSDE